MEANQYFIYLFREKKTNLVIYVGSCKHIAKRLNEHRRAFKEPKRMLPIHKYMKDNNLMIIDDVEFCVVEFFNNVDRDIVHQKEEEYFYKHQDTLKNTRPAENRKGVFCHKSKPIICLNDNKIFVSIREAQREYGIHRETIAKHLNHGSVLKNGLVFKYLNPDEEDSRILFKIKCVEDDLSFSTYKHCELHYGFSKGYISHRCRNGKTEFREIGKTFVKCND